MFAIIRQVDDSVKYFGLRSATLRRNATMLPLDPQSFMRGLPGRNSPTISASDRAPMARADFDRNGDVIARRAFDAAISTP
jgi:hypothetical protein